MKRFLKFLFPAILTLAASAALGADLPPVTVTDFSKGLQTTEDAAHIEDGASQDLQNVDVWTGRLQKRRGSVLQNSTTMGSYSLQAARFLYEFPDSSNNFWLIAVSSASIFKSKDSGTSWTTLTSTHGVTTSSDFSAINAYNKTRLTDGTTNWIIFDGTTVTTSTASVKGKLAAFFGERIWTADVISDRSTLYWSRVSDPEDWSAGGTDDADAGSKPVRKDNGYPIRALVRYKDGLLVFKDFSIDKVTLSSDGLVPIFTPVSSTIGTQHRQSIQVVDNELIFLGPDGFYSYDGTRLTPLSRHIQPTIDSIRQLNSSQRSYTQTTQTDFASGTSSQTSSSLSAGDVVLNTWTDTDTSTTNFSGGSAVSLDTTTIPGSIILDVLADSSFEVYTGYWGSTILSGSGSTSQSSTFAHSGTYSTKNSSPAAITTAVLVASTDNWGTSGGVGSNLAGISVGSWQQQTVDMSAYAGRYVKIGFITIGTGQNQLTRGDVAFYCPGGSITFWVYKADSFTFYFDDIAGAAAIYQGTFTSRAFNTAFTNPGWLASNATYSTAGGSSISFQTQTSSDSSSWGSLQSWTLGSSPTSANQQYIRYKVTVSTPTSYITSAYSKVDDVAFSARALSGRYTSPVISLGSIAVWDVFNANFSTNGGSLTFGIYTDTDSVSGIDVSNSTTYVSSQAITNGSVLTISTAAYAYVSSTFSLTAATQTPTLNDFTLNWNEGGQVFPVASVAYQGDYLCAVGISNTSANDTILVYDRRGAWTKYAGLPAYSMSPYRQKPYFGSNTQGSVYKFQINGIYTDNGSAIDAYWTSKDFDFGYPVTDKTMLRYYITAQRNTSSTVTFSYGVNRNSLTSTSLDLSSLTGFYRKSIVPSSLTYQKGISHRVKFANSSASQYFDILSLTLVPRLETNP